MKKTVLCVSFDETVSANRRQALEAAGYTVATTTRAADALQMFSSVVFDLLIIGHRISSSDKHALSTAAREKGTPVLLICGASAELEIPADVRVYGVEGTASLVATVDRLLGKGRAAAPAA